MTSPPQQQPADDKQAAADPDLPAWLQKADSIPQVDPVAVLGVAPTLSYLIFNAIGGVRPAIAAAMVAGVLVFIIQRRLRPQIQVVRWLMVFSVSMLVGFGIWGIIEEDGKLFWARDFIDNFVLGGLFLLSVLLGRPIVSALVRETFPAIREQLPADHGVWVLLTVVWAIYIGLAGVLRWWILEQVSADTYAWIRMPLGYGLGLVLMLWSFSVVNRTMAQLAVERGRDRSDGPDQSGDAGEVVADTEVAER